ncbi:MAG: methionyl-tRNA formyltransferase, partial [Thermodesulfobacteriota bacterium]
ILLSEKMRIEETDTCATLKDRLAITGADLLAKTVSLLKEGKHEPVQQDSSKATYAPMLKKTDGLIHWDKGAKMIRDLIRGMNPWPGTYTQWNGKRLKVLDGKLSGREVNDRPGTVVKRSCDGIAVVTGDGCFVITMLQPENKKAMRAEDFIRGYGLKEGDSFVL